MTDQEMERACRDDYIVDAEEKAKVEILNWAMQLCGSGMTVGMIRKLLHNKRVEITGEGEKA